MAFDHAVLSGEPDASLLIGIDEVGRGSWMGPVVAAAACFPAKLTPDEQTALARLNDSKKVPRVVRSRLAGDLRTIACFGLGEASCEEVDRLNVHYASLLAARRAYEALMAGLPEIYQSHPRLVLVDGRFQLPNLPDCRQQAIVQGDGRSACIAAASILAKEARDARMHALALEFPGYGWETNVGYGTSAHREGLLRQGPTAHHRLRFIEKIIPSVTQC